LCTNGTPDIGQFFQRLELQAGKQKSTQLKVASWDNIFQNISKDKFKKKGNKILKSIRVALLNPVILITTNNEKEAILSTLQYDPIQEGHSGITKTFAKVKRHYY